MPAKAALELKGRMLSTTRIRVVDADPAAIAQQVQALAGQMPQALRGMAAVLESDVAVDLAQLVTVLRAAGVQPMAVVDGPLAESARNLGLAVVPKDTRTRTEPAGPPATATPAARVARPARVITEPVRSGQQIYAEGADLVVLSTISAGAEVIADGCIHVYGALRGRALAGASGEPTARIFARRFEAELVAVAGLYALADQLKGVATGAAAQVLLQQGKLVIEPLA